MAAGTRYVLDGPGFKHRWKRSCLYLYRLVLGPTQPPARWVLGFFTECKAAGK
jgi:hypothetical protein